MQCVHCQAPFGIGDFSSDPRREELILCPRCGRAHTNAGFPVFGPGDVHLFAVKGVNRWSHMPDSRWSSTEECEEGVFQTSPYSS